MDVKEGAVLSATRISIGSASFWCPSGIASMTEYKANLLRNVKNDVDNEKHYDSALSKAYLWFKNFKLLIWRR